MRYDHLRRLRLAELELVTTFFPPQSRVLEVGAGAGWQAAELSRLGFEVAAVDVAGSAYKSERVWPVQEYDGRHLPFADGVFDVVWSSNVLEHVVEIDTLQAEISRVLRPTGVAVHVLPTATWRLWATLTYYPRLPTALAELWRRKPPRTALLRGLQLLLPNRHGERGNAWSELWFFSRFFWRRTFQSCGWRVVEYRSCRLFYTDYERLGPKLSLASRRALSYVLGSACALYVLRLR